MNVIEIPQTDLAENGDFDHAFWLDTTPQWPNSTDVSVAEVKAWCAQNFGPEGIAWFLDCGVFWIVGSALAFQFKMRWS